MIVVTIVISTFLVVACKLFIAYVDRRKRLCQMTGSIKDLLPPRIRRDSTLIAVIEEFNLRNLHQQILMYSGGIVLPVQVSAILQISGPRAGKVYST
jgi:hypothetical protein